MFIHLYPVFYCLQNICKCLDFCAHSGQFLAWDLLKARVWSNISSIVFSNENIRSHEMKVFSWHISFIIVFVTCYLKLTTVKQMIWLVCAVFVNRKGSSSLNDFFLFFFLINDVWSSNIKSWFLMQWTYLIFVVGWVVIYLFILHLTTPLQFVLQGPVIKGFKPIISL